MANSNLKTESIDGVILRLLKIKPGTELDYETYFDKIKTKLILVNAVKAILPPEENDLLREELTRVRKIKNRKLRFKIKEKTVKVSGNVPSSSQSTSQKNTVGRSPVASSAIVKYKGGDLVPYKKEEPQEEKKDKKSLFTDINKTLSSILKTLSSKFKFEQKQSDQQRKEQETEKRSARESALEGFAKGVGSIVAITKKMLSPFESVIDRIKRFIFFTLLGKAFTMFMNWLSNKENQKKFDNFINFLTKHWPAFAGLYILFGTSFGKLVRGLLKGAIRLSGALVRGIPKLLGFLFKNQAISALVLSMLPVLTEQLKKQGIGGLLENKLVPKEVREIFLDEAAPKELKDLYFGSGGKDNDLTSANKPLKDLSGSNSRPTLGTTPSPTVPPNQIPKKNLGGMIQRFAFGGMNPRMGMNMFQNRMPMMPNNRGILQRGFGVPITGAGSDNRLVALSVGEAVLNKRQQEDLSTTFINKNTGEPLNIPRYLSNITPSYVNASNINPVGGLGRFAGGGMIEKFTNGGMVGGISYNSGGLSLSPNINTGGLSLSPNINTGGLSLSPNINTGGLSLSPSISPSINSGGILLSQNINSVNKMKDGGLVNQIESFFGRLVPPNLFGSQQPQQRQGPPDPTQAQLNRAAQRQRTRMTGAAQNLFDERWRYASDPGNGCMPAINEIYRRAGASRPWMNVPRPDYVPDVYHALSKDRNYTRVKEGQRQSGDIVIWRDLGEHGDGVDPYGHIGIVMPDGRIANNSTSQHSFANLTTPDVAKASWKNTQELIYFRFSPRAARNTGAPTRGSNNRNRQSSVSGNGLGNNFLSIFNNVFKMFGGKEAGGLIGENTGMNIPGGTADRQLTALQPGEFVLPRQTVSQLGVPFIERMVAMTDKNSEAFLKRGSLNIPEITPLKSGGGAIINLPPIDMSSASGPSRARASGYAGGSSVPSFSATSPMNDRQQNAKVFYGIG